VLIVRHHASEVGFWEISRGFIRRVPPERRANRRNPYVGQPSLKSGYDFPVRIAGETSGTKKPGV